MAIKQQAAPKKARRASLTRLLIILDQSGSMNKIIHDVVGGFNGYLAGIKDDGNLYEVTLITFSSTSQAVFIGKALADVPDLVAYQNYQPSGSTALYDAIARTLEAEQERNGTKAKPYGKQQTICIIMTDGQENASTHATKEQIRELIAQREQAKSWTFAYLGANQDAWAEGAALGISAGNTMSYQANAAGTNQAFGVLSRSTTASATSGAQTFTFFPISNTGSNTNNGGTS